MMKNSGTKSFFELVRYGVIGVCTTLVNFVIFYLLDTVLGLDANVANVISVVSAVIFAYVTNKPFVFESHNWTWKVVAPEFAKFVGTRVASWLVETGILFLTVDVLHWNGIVWKLVTSVLVVVLNYVGSKLLVFRGK